jgi:RNA ligase (TIGR02306 family)
MRKLATINEISEVLPIDNADAIEKVRVRGWWCVAKKDEFHVGDRCVYFEIDSLLPSASPQFAFLAKGSREVTVALESGATATGYRLKTVKLRKQISQGLALPVAAFGLENIEDGTDVSEDLGIHLWEPPISRGVMGFARGPFPSFIPKTDEERVQNLQTEIELHKGERCYVTEKLDGTSLTCFWDTEDPPSFHVCSRNLDLMEGDNLYWQSAFPFKELLPGFALQGEVVGEGVQGNPLRIKGRKLYAFNVYDIVGRCYLDLETFLLFCKALGVDTVPIIAVDMNLPSDVDTLIAMADGKSDLNPNCDREGIVIRTQGADRLSFKAISNRYLLGEK